MKPDDLVVVRRKGKSAMAIGRLTGPYMYDKSTDILYRHYRTTQWISTEVPRTAFDQDLLFSFGAIMTICEIRRHDAEKRVRAMVAAGFKASASATPQQSMATDQDAQTVDLEQLSRDQIGTLIGRTFRGHDMARLVDGILKAQGYKTFVSPPRAGQRSRSPRRAGPARIRFAAHLRLSEVARFTRRFSDAQSVDSLDAERPRGSRTSRLMGWL
jgi:restriction system protein